MAHLAGLYHRIERVQCFLDRRRGGDVLVPIAEAAEVVGGAVRPVELIVVDMVGRQLPPDSLERRRDLLSVETHVDATALGALVGQWGVDHVCSGTRSRCTPE